MAVTLSISITQGNQNVTNNTSSVVVQVVASWTGGSYNKMQKSGWVIVDGTKYTFTSDFNYNQTTSGSEAIWAKTLTISHNTDGTKTVACSASYTTGVSSGTIAASASKTLTTIPRKSTLTASNGTLGTAQTLSVTRQSTSFTHTITYLCGTTSGTVCTKSSSTSISWTPPLTLASVQTAGTSVSIKFTITTYSGSTSIGSNTKTITCAIPASVKPSCTLTVSDAAGYLDTYGGYLRNMSKFKVVVNATTSYGSPIASYSTTISGVAYSTSSFTTGVITTPAGSVTISTTVTDERGRKGTASVTVNVVNYFAPIIDKLVVHRCNLDGTENDQGSYIQATVDTKVALLHDESYYLENSYQHLTGDNDYVSCIVEYKKASEESYSSVTIDPGTCGMSEDGTYHGHDYNLGACFGSASTIFTADADSSYDIRVSLTDKFGTTIRTTSASTGFTTMHWTGSGRGMGIGKVAEQDDLLDVAMKARFINGYLSPVLEPDTDLNDVRTPNTYIGANTSSYNYSNCPLTSGTFTLLVESGGEAGQVKQRLTRCHKDEPRIWERWYYSGAWGNWTEITAHEVVLYNDGSDGAAGTITLSEAYTNFKYLEIYFSDNNHLGKGYLKLYIPPIYTGSIYQFDLFLIEAASATATMFRRTRYTLSDKTMTPYVTTAGYLQYNTANSTFGKSSGTNYIRIQRVVGIR